MEDRHLVLIRAYEVLGTGPAVRHSQSDDPDDQQDEQADERSEKAALMGGLGTVSLLIIDERGIKLGQVCDERLLRVFLLGALNVRHAVDRDGLHRRSTEHDHIVAAVGFHDIGNDHCDVVDPTLMERLGHQTLCRIAQVR